MIFQRVVMAASSVAAQRSFYNELLELPLTAASHLEVGVQAGETELVFRDEAASGGANYHFAFRVPGNRFAEAKEWLRDRAPLLTAQGQDEFPWDFWDARAVYTLDPQRNVVELIAFRGLDDADTFSFLGIAELGLPVPGVPIAVERLRNTFSVGLWDREQPAPELITPVGRRGASFIVVTLGRKWFLGDVSGDYPLEVVLDGVRDGDLHLPGQPVRIIGRCSSSRSPALASSM